MKRATLVATSATIALGTIQTYVPAQKEKPTREFIETTYMSPLYKNYQKALTHSKEKSQLRQEALRLIRENKEKLDQMTKQARNRFLEQCANKLLTASNERYRDIELLKKTANRLHVPISYIRDQYQIIAKMNGRVLIENLEIEEAEEMDS